MSDPTIFAAQTLVWSGTEDSRRLFGMIFEDHEGRQFKLTLPLMVAQEALPAMTAQIADAAPRAAQYSKDARTIQVGSFEHEPFVVMQFDRDVPYSFDLGRANALVRDLQNEIADVAARPPPSRQ